MHKAQFTLKNIIKKILRPGGGSVVSHRGVFNQPRGCKNITGLQPDIGQVDGKHKALVNDAK